MKFIEAVRRALADNPGVTPGEGYLFDQRTNECCALGLAYMGLCNVPMANTPDLYYDGEIEYKKVYKKLEEGGLDSCDPVIGWNDDWIQAFEVQNERYPTVEEWLAELEQQPFADVDLECIS